MAAGKVGLSSASKSNDDITEIHSSIELLVDKVYFGSFVARCEGITLSPEELRIAKVYDPEEAKRRKFNIIIPFVETESVKLTFDSDADKGKYLFVYITTECSKKIGTAFDFDNKAHDFENKASLDGSRDGPRAKVSIYFHVKNPAEQGNISEFFTLNYGKVNEGKRTIAFTSCVLADSEYQKLLLASNKLLQAGRTATATTVAEKRFDAIRSSDMDNKREPRFPNRDEFNRTEGASKLVSNNGNSISGKCAKNAVMQSPVSAIELKQETKSFYGSPTSNGRTPNHVVTLPSRIGSSAKPPSTPTGPQGPGTTSSARNGRIGRQALSKTPEVIEICDTPTAGECSDSASGSYRNSTGSRQNGAVTRKQRLIKSLDDEPMLIYATRDGDSVPIYPSDLECLKMDEFLNDTILSFYLAHIHNSLKSPLAQRTHIFNSFFYKKLSTRTKSEKGQATPEIIHSRVKTWTKNFDIFSKDFIVVPVCKNYHWFLTIICFPDSVVSESKDVVEVKKEKGVSVQDEEDQDACSTAYKKSPCILCFDSLGRRSDSGINTIMNPLRSFLQEEWLTKKGTVKKFTREEMPSLCPNVPLQPNSCDCGLYVLQYVEEFLKNSQKLLSNLKDDHSEWFKGSVIKTKRVEIRSIIRKLAAADQQKGKKKLLVKKEEGNSSVANDEEDENPFAGPQHPLENLLTDDEDDDMPELDAEESAGECFAEKDVVYDSGNVTETSKLKSATMEDLMKTDESEIADVVEAEPIEIDEHEQVEDEEQPGCSRVHTSNNEEPVHSDTESPISTE